MSWSHVDPGSGEPAGEQAGQPFPGCRRVRSGGAGEHGVYSVARGIVDAQPGGEAVQRRGGFVRPDGGDVRAAHRALSAALRGRCAAVAVRQNGVGLGAANVQTKDTVQPEDGPHHLAAGLLLLSELPVASGQRAPFSQ